MSRQKPLPLAQIEEILLEKNSDMLSGVVPKKTFVIFSRGVNERNKDDGEMETNGVKHYKPKFIQKTKRPEDSNLPQSRFIDIEVLEVTEDEDVFDGLDRPEQFTVFDNQFPALFDFLEKEVANKTKMNDENKEVIIHCSGNYKLVNKGKPRPESNKQLTREDRPRALLTKMIKGNILTLTVPEFELMTGSGENQSNLKSDKFNAYSKKMEKGVKATDTKISFFATPQMCSNPMPYAIKEFERRVAGNIVTPIEPKAEYMTAEAEREEATEEAAA